MNFITAIEGIIILIGFFYLINMVSHMRNGMRLQVYFFLMESIQEGSDLTEIDIKNWRIRGVLSKAQEAQLRVTLSKKNNPQ